MADWVTILEDTDGFRYVPGYQQWKIMDDGVLVRRATDSTAYAPRSGGEPVTCRKVLAAARDQILKWCDHLGVDPELAIMTVATEADVRKLPFSGLESFRYEGRGRYSIGMFQMMRGAAEAVERRFNCLERWWGGSVTMDDLYPEANEDLYPELKDSHEAPAGLPEVKAGLPMFNIPFGIGFLKICLERIEQGTGFVMSPGWQDPVLVSSCYNAGGLYQPEGRRGYRPGRNPWGIHSYCPKNGDNHATRSVKWANDARFVLKHERE